LGSNLVTVTARDASNNTATDTITITRTDTAAPTAGSHSPAKSATNIPVDASISVVVSDSGSGVDQSTIVLRVRGSVVTPVISGTSAAYTVSYDPPTDFPYGTSIAVSVTADDLYANSLSDSWTFTTADAPIPGVSYGRNSTDSATLSSADTYLNVGTATTNYSTLNTLCTYIWPTNTCANTIIRKYDLSSLGGFNIVHARLYMTVSSSGGDSSLNVSAHKITGLNPVITSATWNTYDGSNNWVSGGGLGNIAAASSSVNVGLSGEWSWDVTQMVKDWVATPSSNYGMLLQAASGTVNSYRFFHSDEGTNGMRPRLVIQTEGGTTPPPPGRAGAIKVEGGMPVIQAPGGLTVIE
jgi:hypothetical protein